MRDSDRVKKTQLDAQLILSIFRQPLHVSAVSRPIIRRYNSMYTTVGTYYYKTHRQYEVAAYMYSTIITFFHIR